VAFRTTPRLSFLVRQKREAKTDSQPKNTKDQTVKIVVPAERKRPQ
jgi:hypothetical protein